jgi:hypothetical protein
LALASVGPDGDDDLADLLTALDLTALDVAVGLDEALLRCAEMSRAGA